jgi:hypothetical protein
MLDATIGECSGRDNESSSESSHKRPKSLFVPNYVRRDALAQGALEQVTHLALCVLGFQNTSLPPPQTA